MSARSRLLVVSFVLLFFTLLTVIGVAENSASEGETAAYGRALKDLLSHGRATSLEIFLEDHPNSRLRTDAFELLIWNYEQNGFLDRAAWAARGLARIAPENAAALAVMAESGNAISGMNSSPAQELKLSRNTATRGLLALPSFAAPHGISAALFKEIRGELKAMLDSALGTAALKSKDYLTAQIHLREAVEMSPENVDRLYALALSYLLATPADNPDGLWFLARVSNLASAPLSHRADQYGRRLSRTLYGSGSRWEDLLAKTQFAAFPEPATATAASGQDAAPPAPASTDADAGHNSTVLKITAALLDANQVLHGVPRLEITVEGLNTVQGTYSRTVITDRAGTAQLTLPAGRYGIVTPHGVTSGEQWYTWDLEVVATYPQNYIQLTNQNATPVRVGLSPATEHTVQLSRATFLGIVVDTSASMADRLSVVKNSLLAALSQMRPGEQAFLLEDGGRPRITQGLTSDVSLLQRAISGMSPNGQSALFDGVIMAANYLRESAGHGTLALLVIANGVDTASQGTLKEAVAKLRVLHVNTYCISTQYDNNKLHDILTRLASNPGGEALFPRLSSLPAVSRSAIEGLSDQSSPSAPTRPPANADDISPGVSQRALHSYSTVIVKEFVVEDGPDTSGFVSGDELLLQKLVMGRMRKYTAFRDVVDGGESRDSAQDTSQPSDRVSLAGIVVGYNAGGRVRRDLVGVFGGVMTLTMRFVFRDAQTGNEVFRTELTSTGGPVFFGGSVEEMRSQAMLRLADDLVKTVNKAK